MGNQDHVSAAVNAGDNQWRRRIRRVAVGAGLVLASALAAAAPAALGASSDAATAQEPTPTPTAVATVTPVATLTPVATPTAVPSVTPAPTVIPTPSITPTPTITSTPTPSPTATPIPPPVPPAEPKAPGTYRVAFYADTRYSTLNADQQRYPYDYPDTSLSAPGRALKLIYAEGTDLVLHGGDMGYEEFSRATPEKWDLQIDQILGDDFPVFASAGNHDRPQWFNAMPEGQFVGLGYRDVLRDRWLAVEQNPEVADLIDCTFDSAAPVDSIGRRSTCVYRNMTFITVDSGQWESPTFIGEPDNQTEGYLKGALDGASTPWVVCNWHFNQNKFQTGQKRDEAGWKPYEYCREAGAVIATGHEHAYSRTHVMSHFGDDSDPGDIVMTGPNLIIDEGQTVAWVSGLGGFGVRREFAVGQLPWWAVKVNATATPNNGRAGAVFCDFQINSNANAVCYFKMIDGQIYDRFELVSNTNGATGTFQQASPVTNSPPFAPAIAPQDVITRVQQTLQLSASDADGPDVLEYWSTDLPAGFTLNRATGLINGRFTQAGTYASTVYAWDGGASARFDVTWNVEPAPITFSSSLVDQCINNDGRIQLSMINTGPLTETIRATITGQPVRTLTVAPGASGTFAWTGRPDGLYDVEVTAATDNSVVFADDAFISCDPPLTSSCLQHNGRIDVQLVNTDSISHTYTVRFGTLTPRVRTLGSRDSVRVTATGRPDGPLSVTVLRDGLQVFTEIVDVDCDLPQVTYARSTTSCLFNNGRVDVYLTNDFTGAATYTVTFGSLAPRSRTLNANGATRVTTTGRPDGPMPLTVDRNGSRVLQQTIFVNCD